MMKKSNKKGFTLVELIVVIAIMAILAAVLVPTVTNKIKDADDSATASDLSAILSDISYKVAEGKALDTSNKPADTKTIKVTTWSDTSVVIEVTFKTEEKAKTVTGKNDARDGKWTLTYTPNTGAKVWAPPA